MAQSPHTVSKTDRLIVIVVRVIDDELIRKSFSYTYWILTKTEKRRPHWSVSIIYQCSVWGPSSGREENWTMTKALDNNTPIYMYILLLDIVHSWEHPVDVVLTKNLLWRGTFGRNRVTRVNEKLAEKVVCVSSSRDFPLTCRATAKHFSTARWYKLHTTSPFSNTLLVKRVVPANNNNSRAFISINHMSKSCVERHIRS